MRNSVVTACAGILAVMSVACMESPVAPSNVTQRVLTPAAATVPPDGIIYQSNLAGRVGDDPKCATKDGEFLQEWHWVINGLASANLAPASIETYFAGAGTVTVPFEKFTGGTAHYTWTYDLDDFLVDPLAKAELPAGTDYNRFNLSHQPCDDGGGNEYAALTVDKTADGAYDNTFTWTIQKSVDKTVVKQVGGTATFNYTVDVDSDGGVIGNVGVTGAITVYNSNGVAVDITGIVDSLSDGTICSVTAGSLTIPANGSSTYTYTCALAGLPAGPIANVVEVEWEEQTIGDRILPRGTASYGTTPISFTGTLVDESVDVDDTYAGFLGTVKVPPAPGSASFSYARTINIPQYDCLSYDNTATFTTNDSGTEGSSSQTVTVCGPVKTGALTMGFWQNKNGQALIIGGTSTGGVCNSGTFLRTYAPFQDLSATATCSKVANYVLNVIKAANAMGASMNAMLKAQMLATALDVFFSSADGGSKIGTGPIGDVEIDLTMICTDLTCTTYQDVSAAFGGATSLSVSELLTYAASQSGVGGVNWYVNDKATQELAKDTFDAINNQKAFAP